MLIASGLVLFVVTFAVNFLGPRDRRPRQRRGDADDHPDPPTPRPDTSRADLPLTHPRCPRCAPALVARRGRGRGAAHRPRARLGRCRLVVVAAVFLFAVACRCGRCVVEGAAPRKDRLVTTLVWCAFGLAMIPLVTLVWTVISKGFPVLSAEFFTYSMRNVIGEGGGIYHAIIGTLLITLGAPLISVPIGIMAAIYLVEYGGTTGSRGRSPSWST